MGPRGDPVVLQVAQQGRVTVTDPVDKDPLTRGNLGQRDGLRNGDLSGGVRNRIPVGVTGGEPHDRVDPGDEGVGDRVFQDLGLVVDLVDPVVELTQQVGLDEPVPADHLQGKGQPAVAQGDVTVRRMVDQPVGGELLDRFGRGGPALPQFFGEIREGCPTLAPVLQIIDFLEVVLRPVGEIGDMHAGECTRTRPRNSSTGWLFNTRTARVHVIEL